MVAGAKARHLAVLALAGIIVATGDRLLGRARSRTRKIASRSSSTGQQQGEPRPTSRAPAYNLDQAKIAIGHGGVLGRGPVQGQPDQPGHVPEQHTDFIFTAVGEELGFVGAAALLVLFALVVWRIWRTALLAQGLLRHLCVRRACWRCSRSRSSRTSGMTMGIMPITGIPLPFMSYGGSSTIANFAARGLGAQLCNSRRFT